MIMTRMSIMMMMVIVVMMVMVQRDGHCILGWGRPHPKVLPRTKMAIMAMMVMVIQSSVFSCAFTSFTSYPLLSSLELPPTTTA